MIVLWLASFSCVGIGFDMLVSFFSIIVLLVLMDASDGLLYYRI